MLDFDAAISTLVDAITDVAGVAAGVAAPGPVDDVPRVDVQVDRFHPGHLDRSPGRINRNGTLEMIVAVHAPGARIGALLHDVVAAIDASPHHELQTDGVDPTWWSAAGATPRPALRVTASVFVEREISRAPEVTEPLVIHSETRHRVVAAVS